MKSTPETDGTSDESEEQGARGTRRRTATVHGERVGFWESIPTDGTSPDGGLASPGSDEVLVLVHGIAGSAHTWAPVFAELERRGDTRHVIAPDLVGHGSSEASWADYSLGGYATGIRDLLAALGYRRATVVGHSLGGGVVQQFALQFPEQCARLVLVSSGGLGREVSPILRAASLPGAEWVLPVLTDPRLLGMARKVALTATRVVPGLEKLTGSPAESVRSFASLVDPVHRRAFVHTVRSVIDPRGQRVSAAGRLYLTEGLPTLIVWGGADSMIPVAHGHRAHELIPDSRLELLEGAGHFPHHDQPRRFTDLLVDFLDGTRPAHRGLAEQAALIAAHADLEPDT